MSDAAAEKNTSVRGEQDRISQSLRPLLVGVITRLGARRVAEICDVTPRAVDYWRSKGTLPHVPELIELAKHDPELRAWVLEQLSVDEDPTRALAVIANALARRNA